MDTQMSYCNQQYPVNGPPQCTGCGEPIYERVVHGLAGTGPGYGWHERCLMCYHCHRPLHDSCHMMHGRLYCELHFFRQYGVACGGCGVGMSPREVVFRAHDTVYHQQCFRCVACSGRLCRGHEFYMTCHNQLVCAPCYRKEEDAASWRGRQRRSLISRIQLKALRVIYRQVTRRPSRSQQKVISADLDLSPRLVQLWFQLARSEERRLQSRATIHYMGSSPPTNILGDDNNNNDDSTLEPDVHDLETMCTRPGCRACQEHDAINSSGYESSASDDEDEIDGKEMDT